MPLPYEDLIKFSNSSEDCDNEKNVTGVDNDSAKFESDIYLFLKIHFKSLKVCHISNNVHTKVHKIL